MSACLCPLKIRTTWSPSCTRLSSCGTCHGSRRLWSVQCFAWLPSGSGEGRGGGCRLGIWLSARCVIQDRTTTNRSSLQSFIPRKSPDAYRLFTTHDTYVTMVCARDSGALAQPTSLLSNWVRILSWIVSFPDLLRRKVQADGWDDRSWEWHWIGVLECFQRSRGTSTPVSECWMSTGHSCSNCLI